MPAEANSVFRRRLGRSGRAASADAQRSELPAQSNSDPRPGQFSQSPNETNRNAERISAPTSGQPSHPSFTNRPHSHTTSAGSPLVSGQTASFARSEWLNANPHSIETAFDAAITHWRGRANQLFSDQVTPVRLASHFSVLVVATLILVMSQLDMPDWQFSLRALPSTSFLGANIGGSLPGGMSALFADPGGSVFSAGESLQRAAVPFTVPNARGVGDAGAPGAAPGVSGEIQKYTVQSGDTVLGIADRFGLQPETIQWANATLEINPDLIRPGDELNILPVNGVLHTIRSGDTLSSIANRYKITIDDIIGFEANGLPSVASPLTVGRQLVIPNGTKPQGQQQMVAYTGGQAPSNARVGSGTFVWPSSGPINQRFWSGHPAIDIGGWTGSPVRAADGGYVAVARGGWNGGYGNHVIIDHGNGFVTLYAHLNSIFVKPGESVTRGQQVGSVGNTGNSTGPHLHFEIRYQGVARNPITYLP